jgi:hypothetical protein
VLGVGAGVGVSVLKISDSSAILEKSKLIYHTRNSTKPSEDLYHQKIHI